MAGYKQKWRKALFYKGFAVVFLMRWGACPKKWWIFAGSILVQMYTFETAFRKPTWNLALRGLGAFRFGYRYGRVTLEHGFEKRLEMRSFRTRISPKNRWNIGVKMIHELFRGCFVDFHGLSRFFDLLGSISKKISLICIKASLDSGSTSTARKALVGECAKNIVRLYLDSYNPTPH